MIHQDITEEAQRVIRSADEAGLKLRLLGGVAIRLRSPSAASHPELKRRYPDIDVVGLRAEGRALSRLFGELGYEPNQRFNALHGYKRMIFYGGERHVDVFLDAFEMCHKIDLRHRLLEGYPTLPLADLLITKLQIIEVNSKDVRDTLALLLDHVVGFEEQPDTIDVRYLARLTADDWGLFTTLSDNLAQVGEAAVEILGQKDGARVLARIEQILAAMNQEPKSLRWRLRARIGRRLEWYELPDEVTR